MKIRLSIRTGHWLLDTIANFRPSNKKKYVRNKACLIRLAIQLCTADEGPLCVTAYHLRLSSHHSTKYYGTDSCALKPGLPVDSSFWFCQNLEFFPLECWVFSWILQRIVSVIDNCHFEQGKLEFHIELFIFCDVGKTCIWDDIFVEESWISSSNYTKICRTLNFFLSSGGFFPLGLSYFQLVVQFISLTLCDIAPKVPLSTILTHVIFCQAAYVLIHQPNVTYLLN